VCELSIQKGYGHYFYGGASDVAEKMVKNLQNRYPGLRVVGVESPPFRDLTEQEEASLVSRVQSAAPDVFWVGLGSPRQEAWMANHLEKLHVPVMAGVGAAFDFLSGNKPQAPKWIQRSGMEWLFRFLSEPTRLWKRYLINYPRFVGLVLLQKLNMIKIPLEF
jgi:N-acetylglucosaminyldiphosphoundecaprenol N-acetyl-beta-D-mannosaminyltransferase